MVALAKHVPQRSRISPGLSLGVVVVEAALGRARSVCPCAVGQHLESVRGTWSPLDAWRSVPAASSGGVAGRPGRSRRGRSRRLCARPPPGGGVHAGSHEQTLAHEGHPEVPLELRERLFALIGTAPVSVDDLVPRRVPRPIWSWRRCSSSSSRDEFFQLGVHPRWCWRSDSARHPECRLFLNAACAWGAVAASSTTISRR